MNKIYLANIILALFVVAGCNKHKTSATTPEALPMTEQSAKETELPEYTPATGVGQIEDVMEGELVPFDGVVLDEETGFAVAQLRIDYDEVYWLAVKSRIFLLGVIRMQEQGLQKSDRRIKELEADLHELRDSWWARNKLVVGIGTGIVLGVVLSLSAGKVWSEMDRDNP
jgi:hypothetical protein